MPFRVGALNSGRIGHFAGNTELYLCEKDHGLHPNGTIDIFGYSDVCNTQLLVMWKRVLNVKRYANMLYALIRHFPDKDKYIAAGTRDDRDILGLYEKYPQHLSFTFEEEEKAGDFLRAMGIDQNDSYICIAVRDPLFLQKKKPYKDWGYHDYRNCSINNYAMAVKYLISRDNYVIRMGADVEEIMEVNSSKYIEYAYKGHRTELMDIYLGATCKFFITCGTGIDAIAEIFRRPLLCVNYVPLEYMRSWGSSSITIFKKHWLRDEKRFMKFREIFESGTGKFLWTQEFTKHGIELIENTPEEMLDVTTEMDGRLNGTWDYTEEDEKLQKRFWSIFPRDSKLHGEIRSRIGTSFLRQNTELLD